MKTKTKDILLKFDEPNRYEEPSDFSYKELANQVFKMVDNLNEVFKLTLIIDIQVQDASFYCDIKIPNELVVDPKPNIGYSIRISNFGKLATINFQEEYSNEIILVIKKILEQHAFIFISTDELDEKYDGQFEDFKIILGEELPTWRTRYFDYL